MASQDLPALRSRELTELLFANACAVRCIPTRTALLGSPGTGAPVRHAMRFSAKLPAANNGAPAEDGGSSNWENARAHATNRRSVPCADGEPTYSWPFRGSQTADSSARQRRNLNFYPAHARPKPTVRLSPFGCLFAAPRPLQGVRRGKSSSLGNPVNAQRLLSKTWSGDHFFGRPVNGRSASSEGIFLGSSLSAHRN